MSVTSATASSCRQAIWNVGELSKTGLGAWGWLCVVATERVVADMRVLQTTGRGPGPRREHPVGVPARSTYILRQPWEKGNRRRKWSGRTSWGHETVVVIVWGFVLRRLNAILRLRVDLLLVFFLSHAN